RRMSEETGAEFRVLQSIRKTIHVLHDCELTRSRNVASIIAESRNRRMDIQMIDQQYSQLQNASQQVEQELKELATKLQAESTSGNQQAREWVLDLKEIALAIQSQQQQTVNLLQAIHGFVANQN